MNALRVEGKRIIVVGLKARPDIFVNQKYKLYEVSLLAFAELFILF